MERTKTMACPVCTQDSDYSDDYLHIMSVDVITGNDGGPATKGVRISGDLNLDILDVSKINHWNRKRGLDIVMTMQCENSHHVIERRFLSHKGMVHVENYWVNQDDQELDAIYHEKCETEQ